MPYEPKLPALLNELAQRRGGHVSNSCDQTEVIEIPQSVSRNRERPASDRTANLPPPSPPSLLGPLSAPEADTAVTDDLDASITRLKERRFRIEFEVPGLDETLWMVADRDEVEALIAEGVAARRIWTLADMADLLRLPGMSHEEALRVARLREAFSATIVEIRPADQHQRPKTQESPAPEPEPIQPELDLGAPPLRGPD